MNSNMLAFVLIAGSAIGFSWQPGSTATPASTPTSAPATAPAPAAPTSRPQAASLPGSATQPDKTSNAANVSRPESVRPKHVTIDFPGGTLAEFTDRIRGALDGEFNLVVSESVRDLPVPPIKLVRASPHFALQALSSSLDDQVVVRTAGQDNDGERSVTSIAPRSMLASRPTPHNEGFEVFPITERVGPKVEALAAIESGLSLLHSAKPPQISFHEPSGLLFVVGSQAQVAAVQSVISALEQRAGSGRTKEMAWLGEELMKAVRASSAQDASAKLKEFEERAAQLEASRIELAAARAAANATVDIVKRDSQEAKKMELDRRADEEHARAKVMEQVAQSRAEAAEQAMAVDTLKRHLVDLEKALNLERDQVNRAESERAAMQRTNAQLEAELRALKEAAKNQK